LADIFALGSSNSEGAHRIAKLKILGHFSSSFYPKIVVS
jgi:hypothetical protein